VKEVRFPAEFHLERLTRSQARVGFDSGQPAVNDWLATKALQQQEKHMSVTKVLLAPQNNIAGYFTLAIGQVDFSDLPADIARRLPRRRLPVAIVAWLGVSVEHQGRGLGKLLLAQALRDCHSAGQTFAFVAVVIDCLDDKSKAFYQMWDFHELPGHPYRLFLTSAQLTELMRTPA